MKLYQVESFEAPSKKEVVDAVNGWLLLNAEKVEGVHSLTFGTDYKSIHNGEIDLSGTFHTATLVYESNENL